MGSPSRPLPSEEFPQALRQIMAAQSVEWVELAIHRWISEQAAQFDSHPAIAILTPTDDGFALAGYSSGRVATQEAREALGTEFAAHASRVIPQGPHASIGKSITEGDCQKVFKQLESFLEWAGLLKVAFEGGSALVRGYNLGSDDSINVVILPPGSEFSPTSLLVFQEISLRQSQRLKRIIDSYRRDQLLQVNEGARAEREMVRPATREDISPRPKARRSPQKAVVDVREKPVLSTSEAASVVGVSRATLARMFDRGEISGFRVPGSKIRRIPREALDAYLAENSGLGNPDAPPTDAA